ncbi:XTP/dITP diphosphatase [Facklamia miroungae]|uniref:dITP/XTP pyrophosphatase n=1 Tax=Facklamia miroungae TaxID=120956 RepID=A0A1G7QXM5_9LACT|nr:XTP/dITP diphosphatase [Facklamia miroungae]NKZ29102.1 XTP/dITP diphosphatase [Facklamia miroungae]SDG03252.1 XTP/dITP diphosphohydrolase [Facklamia miroungae]
MKLIIASHNPGKIAEFKALFENIDLQVQSLLDYPEVEEVEETGKTFEENARLKAETIANQMNCLALSDDSGLCVPKLNNEPGVFSARYAGEEKDDEKNRLKLLDNLKGFEGADRKAYFITSIVLADPQKDSLIVEGMVEGMITKEPVGQGGFGYDSLFYYPEDQKTFAQMSAERKNEISHRGRAVKNLQEKLNDWLEG